MQTGDKNLRKLLSRDLAETLIRLGLVAFLLVVSWRVFEPFAQLVLWALILAVALGPLHQRFAARLGGRQGLSATILVLACLVLLGVPIAFMGESLFGTVKGCSCRPGKRRGCHQGTRSERGRLADCWG